MKKPTRQGKEARAPWSEVAGDGLQLARVLSLEVGVGPPRVARVSGVSVHGCSRVGPPCTISRDGGPPVRPRIWALPPLAAGSLPFPSLHWERERR